MCGIFLWIHRILHSLLKKLHYFLSVVNPHFRDWTPIEDLENEVFYNTSNKNWLLNMKVEKFKKEAFLACERKVFKDDKKPFCPTEVNIMV